ncbi:GldG family protein [Pseudomonas chlororaphis]|uniref:ABC transporter n=1 Tax=Pseudomonas chlororaphis TaxID=587753 RepID=A0A1Q8ER41_9PSED|nr:Gldg family protein [Pseudomonas chlororaphis]OLF54261.1 ABC transporter [Pseudomonas chlororaphis]
MKRILYSGTGLLLIALLFLAFNMSTGLLLTGARLDLTQNKLYSISAGTRQILAELKQPLDLYFYFSDSGSKELVPLRGYAMRVQELLKVYEREAGGKIRLHVVDPLPFSDQEDKASEFGLQALPLGQGGAPVYFGLAATDAENHARVIEFFAPDQEELLEYDISRLLQTLANPKRPTLGLLTSLPANGGFDVRTQQKTEPWMLVQELRREFDLQSLKPDTQDIPQDVDVLMLVHPKKLSQPTLYAIDQFVLRGGKLLAFVDPYSEQDSGAEYFGIQSKDKASDLEPLFKAWGIRLQPGKVVGDSLYALFDSSEEDGRPQPRPFSVGVPEAALSDEDPSTAGLEFIALSTAGIIEPVAGASSRFTPLMYSSDSAKAFDADGFDKPADRQQTQRNQELPSQRYVLAARVQGPVQSAFAEGIEGRKDGLKQAEQVNLVVVADSDLLSDRMWLEIRQDASGRQSPQPWSDNMSFVLNTLDNLAGSDTLNSLRSRGPYSRPFVVVDQLRRQAEANFTAKRFALEERLEETEAKLQELQGASTDAQKLNPEQQAAVRQFMQEKNRIRKELREVQYQLNADIDDLGRRLKIVNIALVPVLLSLCMLLVWSLRYLRRKSAVARRRAAAVEAAGNQAG